MSFYSGIGFLIFIIFYKVLKLSVFQCCCIWSLYGERKWQRDI